MSARTSNETQPRNAAASLRIMDVERLTEALGDADLRFVPLVGGPCDARITRIRMERIHIQRAVIPPHISFGAVHADRTALLITLGTPGAPILNGHEIDRSGLMLLGAGMEIHSVCRQQESWATMSFAAEGFSDLMDECGASSLGFGLGRMLDLPAPGLAALAETLSTATDFVERVPGIISSCDFDAILTDTLRDILHGLLGRGVERDAPERLTHDRLRVVKAADAFMRSHIGAPIYTTDLCSALGVSPRLLRKAFEAACGVSPHAYLKMRRLHLVRRELCDPARGARMVKSVALAHGFWHMGNFARDYCALFGELPHQTSERAPLGS
ncbi:helix-turn-helix domain-containing protein [Sediminicoccus sp. KRV36]|uniref:helix-turn-helix domain-containing protein n=1 Tax=Sediminicoccus sp. KRV36 TaxID=3133721 RepID=UPI00201075D3|nr:helix-turn-helix domain-containing protein [Sediminicoccus rosea]UPY35857.1 helix-turn-helix domain-containing protein [Sediminicoccus rosea]